MLSRDIFTFPGAIPLAVEYYAVGAMPLRADLLRRSLGEVGRPAISSVGDYKDGPVKTPRLPATMARPECRRLTN